MRSLSLLLGLVPLLGLAELGLHQYFAVRAPGFEDYATLAPRLLELKRAGVPVVVAPDWAEPMLRQAAPAAFPLAELARPDSSAYSQFLEVSLLGASSPELSSFAPQRRERVGAFELIWRVNPKPEPVVFDFVTAVEQGNAEVFTEEDGQRWPCRYDTRARRATGGLHGHVAYPATRFECGGQHHVGVTLIDDQSYRPRRCVLAQPPDSGSLVLRFTAVPVSSRFVGFAGFSYFLERDMPVDQVELSVVEQSTTLGHHRVAGARGWSRFELARRGEAGAVEVQVRRLQASQSDFCFALEAR